MNSLPIFDEIQVKGYDFNNHSFYIHTQQRGLGTAGIIINPPEEAAGHSFIPLNVKDRGKVAHCNNQNCWDFYHHTN
jgi:hypothetical protein